ncbi:MAG: RNA polymerase sigma-54 factor [Robiginitomaculum sp.]|nr:MAG: RNA polymerase sigma-54 factor [Robiginitomaculum sp.]
MALAPQIQLKQGQSLTMTPQLQQAIKLLQLSNIELAAFVEEQLESNPLLERGTGTENRRTEDAEVKAEPESGLEELNLATPNAQAADAMDASDSLMNADATTAELAPSAPSVGGEIDWSKASSGGSFNGGSEYDAASNTAHETTLNEHLTAQLVLEIHDTRDRLIGAYLIDNVDENGYLRADLAELSERLGVNIARVQSVLNIMQGFEPTGVMAQNLSECLGLQLKEKNELDAPMQILLDNLELLANHDLPKLCKLCDVSTENLGTYILRLRSLAPKPGLAFGSESAAVVEPDVFVRERPDGGWSVELNTETLPRVLVNSRYFAEICGKNADQSVKTYMSECQQNASWLVKSLDQRARTILKVSSEIVKQQDGFFAYGIDHLRPLNLRTVADAIEMHESTVSRVTSNKYIATPRGTFELKYFFTAAIASMDGSEALSAEAVRHKIKILISEEKEVKSVLSDDKIVDLLRAQGVDVARRTVAKYRESLGIQSSVQRRRILKNAL